MTSYFEQRLAEIKANPDLIAKPKPHPRHKGYWAPPEPEPTADYLGRLGWVYFILNQTEDVVKIGFTGNRPARLSELQTGNHHELSLECSVPAYESTEKLLHKHFAEHRVRGEWFRMHWRIEELWDDLMDYQGIRCVARCGPDSSGLDLIEYMDTHPLDNEDVELILSTIGKPWPQEFRLRLSRSPAPSLT